MECYWHSNNHEADDEIRALLPAIHDLKEVPNTGFIVHRIEMYLAYTNPNGSPLFIPRGICPREVDWKKEGLKSELEEMCDAYEQQEYPATIEEEILQELQEALQTDDPVARKSKIEFAEALLRREVEWRKGDY